MSGAIPPLPNTSSWHGAQLKEAQGQQLFLILTPPEEWKHAQSPARMCAVCSGVTYLHFVAKHL
jgi:hypothetical protein